MGTREISDANAKRLSISETVSEKSKPMSNNGKKTMLPSETQPHLAPSTSVRTLAQSPPFMKTNTETPSSHDKPGDKVSSSPTFSIPHSNMSSPLSLPISTTATLAPMPLGNFLSSSKAIADVNKTTTLRSPSSIYSGSLSFKAPNTVVSRSILSPTIALKPVTYDTELNLLTADIAQRQIISTTQAPPAQPGRGTSEITLKQEAVEPSSTANDSAGLSFGSQPSFNISTVASELTLRAKKEQQCDSDFLLPTPLSFTGSSLFRPASFSFQHPQPSEPSQPVNLGFFGGFTSGSTSQAQASSAFGQPAQIGQGQQALGSVLGSFGQSRQIGFGLPGAAGGFAGVASGVGGFAGAASGGFAAAGSYTFFFL
ncbi:hypothetical protein RJ641_016533, partial [Dillenia turbinata]